MTIRDVTIKTPHRKWDRGRECRHARKSWGFGNLKKENSWDLNSERESWDSSLEECSLFLGSTKCAARLLKKLCFSLLMSKNLKLKMVNKSFVSEPKKRVVSVSRFFGFLCLWTLWTFYACEYLGRIFLDVNICYKFSSSHVLGKTVRNWTCLLLRTDEDWGNRIDHTKHWILRADIVTARLFLTNNESK